VNLGARHQAELTVRCRRSGVRRLGLLGRLETLLQRPVDLGHRIVWEVATGKVPAVSADACRTYHPAGGKVVPGAATADSCGPSGAGLQGGWLG